MRWCLIYQTKDSAYCTETKSLRTEPKWAHYRFSGHLVLVCDCSASSGHTCGKLPIIQKMQINNTNMQFYACLTVVFLYIIADWLHMWSLNVPIALNPTTIHIKYEGVCALAHCSTIIKYLFNMKTFYINCRIKSDQFCTCVVKLQCRQLNLDELSQVVVCWALRATTDEKL